MRKSHGSIDRCTSEYIDGWFYCKDNKKIDIYADSVLVDTIYASKVREDVNSALNIQSVTGFTYFFNLSHTPVVVEIKFHNTDTHLNNSPIFVERNQLTNKTTTQRKRTTNSKKRILFLLSTYDGGTVHTTNDLIQGIKNKCECFILHAYKQELALYNNSKCLGKFFLNEKVLPLTHSSQEYDSIIKQIIIDYNIDVVHIRHICWHSLSFIEHIKELNVLIVFSFHD